MSFHFLNPLALVVAAIVLLLGVGLWRGMVGAGGLHARRSLRWRVICFFLPFAATLLLAIALAHPVITLGAGPARDVVILVDLSDSTRGQFWRDPLRLQTDVTARLGNTRNTTITLVAFARNSQLVAQDLKLDDPRGWPLDWPPLTSVGEDRGASIRDVLAWRRPDEAAGKVPLAPRLLYTDGLFDARETVPAFPLHIVARPATAIDVAVRSVTLSRKEDGSGRLFAAIAASGPITVNLSVQENGRPVAQRPVRFDRPGGSERLVEIPFEKLPPLDTQLTVAVQSEDLWPENNMGSLLVTEETPTRVLVIGEAMAGLNADRKMPGELQTSDGLRYGAIVVNDVPFAAAGNHVLTPATVARLDEAVREQGVGLLLVGRSRAFGPGRYYESAVLEALSPLASLPPDRPPVKIVFLLDASASMNQSAGAAVADRRFSLAVAGVMEAVRLLKPEDELLVLAFNTVTTAVARGPLKTLPTLRERLLAVQPNGTTTPDSALDVLREQLAPGSMLVLLTDGEVPQMDVQAWRGLLKDRGTMLTVISPRTGETKDELTAIANAVNGVRLKFDEAGQWPALLRRAVAERLAGRVSTERATWESGDLQGSASTWIETFAKSDAPLRARLNQQRAGAAIAQRGLGKVAAMSFEDERLARKLLAEVSAPGGDRRFVTNTTRANGGWRVTVDARDGAQFMNNERLTLTVGRETHVLRQVAPGRYEAVVETTEPLAGVLTRSGNTNGETREDGRQLVGRVHGPLVATGEYPASVLQTSPVSGAHYLDVNEQIVARAEGRRLAMMGWLIGLASALLLGSLWLRRVTR